MHLYGKRIILPLLRNIPPIRRGNVTNRLTRTRNLRRFHHSGARNCIRPERLPSAGRRFMSAPSGGESPIPGAGEIRIDSAGHNGRSLSLPMTDRESHACRATKSASLASPRRCTASFSVRCESSPSSFRSRGIPTGGHPQRFHSLSPARPRKHFLAPAPGRTTRLLSRSSLTRERHHYQEYFGKNVPSKILYSH
jgi:hypothetical protein